MPEMTAIEEGALLWTPGAERIAAARLLGRRTMPGAQWFPGARLNYAEHALRHERDGARRASSAWAARTRP